jgi:hypothetical protein
VLNAPISSNSKFCESGESCEAKGEAKKRLMSVRSVVLAQFELIAKEQNRKMPPLSDDLLLLDSGLDSLCFAIVVARLEDVLGRDPFNGDSAVDFPVTLQDFINLYEDDAK